ncbi:MAG: prepilin-type N-terminal cleavage/methylation domain-containing protein [Planctomycetota bacterium]|jgi:type II secretory pathway pseudopilin PulG
MRRHQAGHTVIELLVVVAVLMFLAGIVIPSGTVSDDRKLDTLQLQLQDAMDHAKSLAYHSGSVHGVRVDATGNWFAVVNEVGIPIDDPLSHGDYVIRLDSPGQPNGIKLDYANFGTRPVAVFNEKGVLEEGGQINISTKSSVRWLFANTATAKLAEIPVTD